MKRNSAWVKKERFKCSERLGRVRLLGLVFLLESRRSVAIGLIELFHNA